MKITEIAMQRQPPKEVVKICSADNGIFTVDAKIVKVSKTLRDILQNSKIQYRYKDAIFITTFNNMEKCINMRSIKSNALKLVIEWAAHHQHDYEDWDKMNDIIMMPEWDEYFFDTNVKHLTELSEASRVLQMRGLGNFCNLAFGKQKQRKKLLNLKKLKKLIDCGRW